MLKLCWIIIFIIISLGTQWATSQEKGLFPSVFNLATNSIIIANATCGENSSELYCKLVEHVSMREPQCSICDARSDFPDYRHPIVNAIDGTNRWWQSPTLQNGKNFEWVTITLDLKQIFQVVYVIVKTAISPRPGNWILERSRDGRFYKPWQYYAISDAECWEAYGIPPTVGQPRYRSDDEIICTSYYSKLNPLENAEIHTSLVNGRPGAEDPSDALREFTTARYVRLRLQKIRTLNADLMTLQTDDPRKIDKSTTRRYFYSIKDISIGGQCVCHGHAILCPVDFETNLLRCKCEHNTCGENCEQCCPLYQQKPWKPGTHNDGAVCEKCQCFGHTEICFYDQTVADKKASLNINGEYDGGGVCVKCRNHTTGINCEQCEDGYYRPIGVGREDPNPCRRCKCAGPGVTGFCFKDDSFIQNGVQPGDCICKLGFAGSQCDRCASGYKNFPNCELCPCNIAGTKGGTACEGNCVCKNNVEGVRCDVCKANHYNLDPQNPDGCTPCYCSGITDQCQSSDWRVKVISNLKSWKISDLYGTHVVYPTVEEALALMISDNDMNRRDVYYWSAPPEYLGKKLYSYGGELRYVVSYSVTGEDSRIAQIKTPGVLIEGDNTRIGHYFGIHHQIEGNISVALPLQERVWFLITAAGKRGKPASRIDFSRIINNITRLLIRAKYHPDQTMGILYNAEIEIASYESTSIKVMRSVEQCTCPLGYAGLSCEVCEHGYRRVNNVLHKGVCELCMCNNHAHSCDPYTGYCEDCLHNTTGLFCQQCKYGFHGDPVHGTTEDCKLCACPLENPENNFSPDCNDVTLPDGSVDYICTWCDQGYTGNKCERCDAGYFGQPSVPGEYCQLCDCTGNEDINDPNFCDHITGDCLKCINNTRGLHCEECLELHYGSAYKHSCKPCECSPVGSKSSMCDPENGGCDCKENYEGKNCDRCIIGHGNIELNCVPCDCNMTGSIRKLCDSVSGKCVCKPGIGGLRCDSCLEGFYSYSDTGCKSCECNIMGSISRKCDGYGNCTCKPYVKGQKCNGCYPGYWNLLSGNGCQECNCHPIGSLSSVCDIHEGNCSCRPGVEAPKCDHCKRGFYGFSEDGCKKCRNCKEGRVCDPETGECVCPPYTTGRLCERCVEASFGHDPIRGCQPCDCSEKGSPKGHNKCDVVNGNCLCLEGFEGRRCDKCRFAHYNFPTCIRCECRYDGTEPSKCSAEGLCQCDESGSCTCKVNVIGKKCDKCKPATFGMSLENPKGCFDCFCFNRSKTCDQAKMMWSLLKGPVREAHFEFGKTPLSSLYNFTLIPGRTGNVKIGIPLIIKQPVYWMLPREFIGEKIRSYNGILQFHIESRSSEQFPDPLLLKYPLVILEGFPNLVLVHTLFLPTSKGYYSVRFHEDEWRQWQNPDIVINRAIMMTALRNVQNILIRATEGGSVTIARISDISMEVAVPISPIPASPYVAVGVEKCTCPKEYSGTSCQDPGRGFYRKFKPNFNESEDIIDFIGFAAPCPCKNRSETCDPETGHCYNCRENTAGAFCERCAKGFFGNPDIAPCKPCACPLPTNSFSDTCEGDGNDHNCTNCQDGYEGKNCERCMIGFYGNPMIPGDSCKPCNCNSYGSFSRICDRMTGQCQCRKGISGRDCTYCQPRYVLTDLGCKSCDDDCTRPLLDDTFYLIEMAEKANISNLVLPPWIPLLSFDDQITQLKSSIARYHSDLANALNISQNFMLYYDYESLADFMHLRGRDINIKTGPLAFDALEIKEDAEAFIKHVEKLWKHIYGTVTLLQQENKNLTFSAKAIDAKIKVAERFLKEIKQKDLPDQREEAERELRKVIAVMDQVRQAIMDYELFLDKQSQLSRLTHILSETIRLIERSVKRKNTETSMKVSEEKQLEERIYSQILMSSEMHSTANTSLVDANDLLAAGEKLMNNATIIFEKLPPIQERLENGTEQLEHRRGILARLNPRYIQKFVIPAKDHAAYLSEQAMYLSNMFRATNIAAQSSLQAAQIYDKIIDLIDLAEQVAIMTSNTADRVAYEAQPSSSFTPLSRQAFLVKRNSINLREDAIQFMLDAQALQEALNQKKLVLNKLAIDIANGTNVISHINENVNLSRNIGDRLHDIEEGHKRTIQTLDIVHHNVTTLSLNIDSRLYSELDQIRLGSSAGLSIINKHIDEGKSIMTDAIDKANGVENRVEKVKNLNQDLQSSLKTLKNKILLAHQRSSNIRISLGANKAGICVRSYRPEIEPTTTTNIILNYAISSNDRDSLLFFLASSITKDFMIIEMVNRKIRFLWNAGGGTQVIQHNLTIESNDEQMLRNERWYKIEVKRFGNVATLSVKSTPDGQKADPHEVTDASPVGYSQMDLDSNSFFYIGGTPKGYRVPRELKARNFAGCLYEVILDGKKVGLWNFLTSQGCSGCKEGATEEADFSAYSFKGDGYAILPQIRRYKKTSYVVTLRFKTFDEDALIFFSPNLENGDFVSIELRNGHLVYQFNLGSQSRSMLKTSKKYNTGNWTLLSAVRDKLQGQLSVDDEFLEGQLPARGPIKMELQNSLMYFGGVPPNFTNTVWNGITFQKFLGCMKDLQIDSTPLNLLKNGFFSVEPSCAETPIRSVSFRGNGYLEIASHPLLLETSFGFSFHSLQSEAILLLSTFEIGRNGESNKKKRNRKIKDFYSVAIVEGHLEARFSGGHGVASVSNSSVKVNDGIYHTVTFLKRHRGLMMRIDDTEVGSSRLPKGSKDIDAPMQRGLFLGGIQEGIIPGRMIATKEFLIGTIKDLIFDNKLLHFNQPVDFKGAGIGRTLKQWVTIEPPYTGVTQPLERCAEMASYLTEKSASNFGDSLFSYAKMAIGRKSFEFDFNVTLDIRTYYPNGLIVLVRNGGSVSHLAIMLLDGSIAVDVFDRKARYLASQVPLSDGDWHHISITKVGRRIQMKIDKHKKITLKVRRRLGVDSPMYVGGVPENFKPIEKVVYESFKGCIREFHLNGKYLDLARGELHFVNSCFSTIERGAYFNGDAYATYDDRFDLGIKLDVQMEFKTTRLNGVLLSLTAESGLPSLALELVNGSVIVTVALSEEDKPFSAKRSFQSKYEMCDGQWHMVTMQYAHKAVTLKIDMYEVSYGLSENVPLVPQTSDPLYIAGLPDDAPTGAHNIRDNFVGCLKNIAVNDRRVNWMAMPARHNVQPNSCPTF